MIKINFEIRPAKAFKILCLGAHGDDIELGCGGTILNLIKEHENIEFYWIVFSADKKRAKESIACAQSFLRNVKKKRIEIKNYKDSFFPYIGSEIKDYFEELKQKYSPDIVFSHYRHDLHQDHRLISELTWNSFRNHLILEYEVLKYDGDLGAPNFFVELRKSICQKKVKLITENFKIHSDKSWFSEDAFLSLLRLRGIEANSASGYAEAFYCRKMVL